MSTSVQNPLGRSTAIGLVWLVSQSLGARCIGFLAQIALARLLMPSDFGSLGLATTVTAIVGAASTFGVDEVLLQRQRTMAFWSQAAGQIAIALSLMSFVLVWLSAPVIAIVYKEPVLKTMLPIMAGSMPIAAVTTVHIATLRSELKFPVIAKINLAELFIIQSLTVIFAWIGFGPLSFAIGPPIATALRSTFLWITVHPQIRTSRRRQYAYMLKRGGAVVCTRLVTAAVNQGDYLLLGLFAPSTVVGFYFFAFRLAVQPVFMIAGNLTAVLFPALARLQIDPGRQGSSALRASRLLAAVVMPYCFLQAALARPAVELMFGHRWINAVPIIQILSVGLAFDAIPWVAGAVLSARGEFSRGLKYSVRFAVLYFIIVSTTASTASAIYVAIGVSAYYVILGPWYTYLVFRSASIPFRDVVAAFMVPGTIALVSNLTGMAAGAMVSGTFNNLAVIATICSIFSAVYVGTLRAATPTLFFELYEFSRTVLRKPLGRNVSATEKCKLEIRV